MPTAHFKGIIPELSEQMTKNANADFHLGITDPNLLRKPDNYVFVFSVSKRDIPSIHQLVKVGVKAVAMDAPVGSYVLVARIPNPYQIPEIDQSSGAVKAVGLRAVQVAQDYCNSSNTSSNQDLVIPEQNIFSSGNNLNRLGVFWVEDKYCTFKTETINGTEVEVPIPPKAEVTKAEKRQADYFASLLERARTLEHTDEKQLEIELNIDYHLAADFYQLETSWHKKFVRNVDCPNCGEPINPSKKFHFTQNGVACIQPSEEGWREAESTLCTYIKC